MTQGAYRQIFARRDFRRFWAGFTLSTLGDALSRTAFTWYVYELTGSATALGWLMVCYTGPIIVGGLVAGWLLDRFERRTVLIADSLIRGAALGLIPLLAWLGVLQLWQIYAVAAAYGLLMMVALAGGPTLMPSLVPPALLPTANALELLSFTLAGVIGPALAGLLIPAIGAPGVALLDALSYLAFALLLRGVRLSDQPDSTATPASSYGLGDAVRLLLSQPVLRATTLMFLVFNIGGTGMLNVALPILADQRLGGGSQLYGALLAALAAGEMLGAALAGALRLRLALGARICVAQALAGLALLPLLVGGPWLTGGALALFGLLSAPLTAWAQTLRMQVIPAGLRGRSFALLRMLMQSGSPLGGALGGWLLPLAGVGATLALAAALVGLPGLLGAATPGLREAD
jgi:MFS family permease